MVKGPCEVYVSTMSVYQPGYSPSMLYCWFTMVDEWIVSPHPSPNTITVLVLYSYVDERVLMVLSCFV